MWRPAHGATSRPGPCRPASGYGRASGRPGPCPGPCAAGSVAHDGSCGALDPVELADLAAMVSSFEAGDGEIEAAAPVTP